MDSVNRTLYIPLYGKARVSRQGILLSDPAAEKIWDSEGFELHGKAKSKWLCYYMGMRSAVFDYWLSSELERYPDAVVLGVGCGLDSRILRVGSGAHRLLHGFCGEGFKVQKPDKRGRRDHALWRRRPEMARGR